MSSSAYVSLCLAIYPHAFLLSSLDTLICRHVSPSAALLASRHPPLVEPAYLLPTQLHDCFAYALRYTLHASLAFAYNHSCMPCTPSSLVALFPLSFFSWCLLFQSSITLNFTFSWLLRGQFSIFVGLSFTGPHPHPLLPTPFSNFWLAGTIFLLRFVPARSRRFFGS